MFATHPAADTQQLRRRGRTVGPASGCCHGRTSTAGRVVCALAPVRADPPVVSRPADGRVAAVRRRGSPVGSATATSRSRGRRRVRHRSAPATRPGRRGSPRGDGRALRRRRSVGPPVHGSFAEFVAALAEPAFGADRDGDPAVEWTDLDGSRARRCRWTSPFLVDGRPGRPRRLTAVPEQPPHLANPAVHVGVRRPPARRRVERRAPRARPHVGPARSTRRVEHRRRHVARTPTGRGSRPHRQSAVPGEDLDLTPRAWPSRRCRRSTAADVTLDRLTDLGRADRRPHLGARAADVVLGRGGRLLGMVRFAAPPASPIPGDVAGWLDEHLTAGVTIDHVNDVAPGIAAVLAGRGDARIAHLAVEPLATWVEGGSPSATRARRTARSSTGRAACGPTPCSWPACSSATSGSRPATTTGSTSSATSSSPTPRSCRPRAGLFVHGSHHGETIRCFWGRANAWCALAAVEFLELAGSTGVGRPGARRAGRPTCLARQLVALADHQPDHGVWSVLVDDHPEYAGIVETSAAAGIGAAMLRAAAVVPDLPAARRRRRLARGPRRARLRRRRRDADPHVGRHGAAADPVRLQRDPRRPAPAVGAGSRPARGRRRDSRPAQMTDRSCSASASRSSCSAPPAGRSLDAAGIAARCRSAVPRPTSPCTSPGSAFRPASPGAVGNDPFGRRVQAHARPRGRRRQHAETDDQPADRPLRQGPGTGRHRGLLLPRPARRRARSIGSRPAALDGVTLRARQRHPRLARSRAAGRSSSRCSTAPVPVSFDVNHRPALWSDGDAATALRELASRADDGVRRPRRGGRRCGDAPTPTHVRAAAPRRRARRQGRRPRGDRAYHGGERVDVSGARRRRRRAGRRRRRLRRRLPVGRGAPAATSPRRCAPATPSPPARC